VAFGGLATNCLAVRTTVHTPPRDRRTSYSLLYGYGIRYETYVAGIYVSRRPVGLSPMVMRNPCSLMTSEIKSATAVERKGVGQTIS